MKKQEVLHYYFNPENLLLVSEKINHDLEKTQKHGKIPLLDLESISDSGRLYLLPNFKFELQVISDEIEVLIVQINQNMTTNCHVTK